MVRDNQQARVQARTQEKVTSVLARRQSDRNTSAHRIHGQQSS